MLTQRPLTMTTIKSECIQIIICIRIHLNLLALKNFGDPFRKDPIDFEKMLP